MNDAKKRLPRWDDSVPRCSEDDCPMFDGKRCEELGHRPSSLCEPAVSEIVATARSMVGAFKHVGDERSGLYLAVTGVEAERRIIALRTAVTS